MCKSIKEIKNKHVQTHQPLLYNMYAMWNILHMLNATIAIGIMWQCPAWLGAIRNREDLGSKRSAVTWSGAWLIKRDMDKQGVDTEWIPEQEEKVTGQNNQSMSNSVANYLLLHRVTVHGDWYLWKVVMNSGTYCPIPGMYYFQPTGSFPSPGTWSGASHHRLIRYEQMLVQKIKCCVLCLFNMALWAGSYHYQHICTTPLPHACLSLNIFLSL